MRSKLYFLTYLWTLPAALVSWMIVLFIWLCWGSKLEWIDGLWCELKYYSWPTRTWYKGWGGTTFVMGGFYNVGRKGELGLIDTETEAHEHRHIAQTKANCLAGMLAAIVVFAASGFSLIGAIPALIVWTIFPFVIYGTAVIQSYLEGTDPYRDNYLEEHAYLADDLYLDKELDKALEELKNRYK